MSEMQADLMAATHTPLSKQSKCSEDRLQPGWPPDGDRGYFVGFGDDETPALCQWDIPGGLWMGLRFCPRTGPQAFTRGPETESFIVKHISIEEIKDVDAMAVRMVRHMDVSQFSRG